MLVKTDSLVAMSEANQNFSKVTRLVDENGLAVILKNNKPRYVLVDFGEYDEIQELRANRAKMINETANLLIDENLEAFKELAKWFY